jgi:hypothetical protein
MGSPAEPLHHSERIDRSAPSSQDLTEAVTEFESESVITTRRIRIDTDPQKTKRHAASAWGYLALIVAFVLGVITALGVMLLWR